VRLSVSNIGWGSAPDDPAVLELLRDRGVEGIDVAPTRLWPGWEGASLASAEAWRAKLEDAGFVVPAAQSLLYQRPELTLFGDEAGRRALVEHIVWVASLLEALGGVSLVFGSPKLRDPGGMDPAAAFARARETFREIGDRVAELGTCLCIEPNPPVYGCTFVNTSAEGRALVEAVDSPGFGLHLDASGCRLAGEDPAQAVRDSVGWIQHMHASEPQLGSFEAPVVDHAGVGAALAEVGYDRWLSIEMRPHEPALERLAEAVDHVTRAYGVGDG